jgi:hypothetical protein
MTIRIPLTLLAIATTSLFFTGCGQQEQPAQTVSWYKEHQAEREAKLEWCYEDVTRATTNADCLNAEQAEKMAMFDKPSTIDTFKYDITKAPGYKGKK